VDDHRIIRQGLRYLIESVPEMTVVGEAHDGRDAQTLMDEQHPDVIVMDIAMPGLNGIEATRQIVNQAPQARVIALSQFSQRRYVTEMLKAGARGYVLKEDAFEELVNAIQTVLDGKLYLSPRVADVVIDDYLTAVGQPEATAFTRLSPREREVIQLMSEGSATKEIAKAMNLSLKTVETHRRNIMEKLKLYSVAELTKYAVREGLTSVDR
jgi:DNA-binding NarL/FixJ family response regulator